MQGQRYIFIDYLRGFIFALMAIDHSLHAYAQNWGQFWFIQDHDRSLIWDAFYLFDQSIIMPMLFFITGLWVLPSLKKYGFQAYLRRRFVKLGIPFIICIPLIVPLMTYPRYTLTVDSDISYLDYWFNVFLSGKKLQAGPLWVMYGMFLYSMILVGLSALPGIMNKWSNFVRLLVNRPQFGFIFLFLLSALILGMSDLTWGAPWWIGWGVFYLPGARFLLYFLYFMLGAGFSQAGLLEDRFFWKRLSDRLPWWAGIMGLSALAYVGYSLIFMHDGAYSDVIRHAFHEFFALGSSWSEMPEFVNQQGWQLIESHAPRVLIRTTLHGTLCLFQVLTLLAFSYRYFNKEHPVWSSLARSCYGIFLTHEAMVIWLQYFLIGIELPQILKIIIIAGLGFGGSWLLTEKWLLKIPVLKKVIG
ncbi:hypothetical protein IM40_03955 [Candidatus Paracaedimonas acanthamoebae]|nr:hypothetical protein IM40_03955 [Candidatus Paracaedimonas acanthamoebae]